LSRAEEGVYSPDGSKLAVVAYRGDGSAEGFDGPVATSDLFTIAPDGSGLHRLTKTPKLSESAPSWDPSGRRLAYTRASEPESLGFGDSIVEANADGSCPRRLLGRPGKGLHFGPGLYAPVWQPGPGREAGPMSC
jgi:Tol biopolymer transport system component